VTRVAGLIGCAASLDGASLLSRGQAIPASGDWSLEIWVNPTALTPATQTVAAEWDSNLATNYLSINYCMHY
jgi:hypothetical protein